MHAQQITPRVRRWLRNSRSARVLYLFKASCTLVNERREAISLVSPEIGPGPFSAVLAGDFTTGLDIHQPIGLNRRQQTVTVGPLLVDCRESALWQPRPDWSRLRGAEIDQWPPAGELPADIQHYLTLTIEGIRADDTAHYLAGVEGLVGRGGGLTPTGDDVLLGVLYALWVWYPHHFHRPRSEWMEMTRTTAWARTTTLSANFIDAAAAGEATWPWHELVSGRPQAVERILSTGHTSGAEAWAGFTYAGSVLRSVLMPGSA